MQKQGCKHCGQIFGLNQLVSVFDEVLCRDCAEKRIFDVPKDMAPQVIRYMQDPTVCTRCKADNGLDAYELFLEMPLCPSCREHIKKHPFPFWIKAACVVIILIVGFAIYMNLRFFRAHVLFEQSISLGFQEHKWEQAAQKMEKAATLVPENQDIKTTWHYMAGYHALQSEHYEEAVEHLEYCTGLQEYHVGYMLLEAQSGVAFNKKDYPELLRLSQEVLKLEPNDPMRLAQVSSAYACVYAITGQEADKLKCMDYLGQAEQCFQGSIPEDFAEHKERILYRLETRQILTKKVYDLKNANKEK
jgi:hypothetical protein